MIQPSEARELCSKSEWGLVESSFSPMVETFQRSGLKSRIDRISIRATGADHECSRSLLLELFSRAKTGYPLTLSKTCSVTLDSSRGCR